MKNYLGIDIGGTSVKIGIVNELGEVLANQEFSVSFNHYKTPIIETVVSSLKIFISNNPRHYEGIGVSAAGQIDTASGKVIGTCGNLPNYVNSPLKERFESEFHLPVTVVNDANCMLLGEKWIGSAQDSNDVIGITLGTGVGGGIITNGTILLGARGLAGEIGHIIINKFGSKCTCLNNGCFEQYASVTSLIQKVKVRLNILDNIDGRWIFSEASQGNDIVNECLNEWIEDISIGLASLTHVFNPSMILIGGGVSSQTDLLINPLREKILSKIMPRFADNLIITQASLLNNAGLVGAVHYFIHNN